MTDTRDWAYEKAREIVHRHCGSPDDLINGIVKALRAAARVQPGHVRTDDGTERKVLGVLPVTADGCVVGEGGVLFYNGEDQLTELFRTPTHGRGQWVPFHPHKAHSTRAAAEAAKTGGG